MEPEPGLWTVAGWCFSGWCFSGGCSRMDVPGEEGDVTTTLGGSGDVGFGNDAALWLWSNTREELFSRAVAGAGACFAAGTMLDALGESGCERLASPAATAAPPPPDARDVSTAVGTTIDADEASSFSKPPLSATMTVGVDAPDAPDKCRSCHAVTRPPAAAGGEAGAVVSFDGAGLAAELLAAAASSSSSDDETMRKPARRIAKPLPAEGCRE